MADYQFPPDLLALQRAWFAADARRTEAAGGDGFMDAHKATQDATTALYRHPWWKTVTGERYQASEALRAAARAGHE